MSRALAWIGLRAVGISWLVGRKRSPDEDGARDEVDALARVITSEADGYSEVERTAIAWCVRNRARKRGTSIAKLVCTPTCGPCCHGRPFSSARPSDGRQPRVGCACARGAAVGQSDRWRYLVFRAARARQAQHQLIVKDIDSRRRSCASVGFVMANVRVPPSVRSSCGPEGRNHAISDDDSECVPFRRS